jgi:hypothetical protein
MSKNAQINIEEVDVLERIFLVIAYGVRYLERELVTHFQEFCASFKKLFFLFPNTQVRRISAEAISYLIKKNPKQGLVPKLLSISLGSTEEMEGYQQDRVRHAVSYALFSALTGVGGYLSCDSLKLLRQIWSAEIDKRF